MKRGSKSTNTFTKRTARRPRSAGVTDAEIASWFDGKCFSEDWTSWHFPDWIKLLASYRDGPVRVLEIGSWEGRVAHPEYQAAIVKR